MQCNVPRSRLASATRSAAARASVPRTQLARIQLAPSIPLTLGIQLAPGMQLRPRTVVARGTDVSGW